MNAIFSIDPLMMNGEYRRVIGRGLLTMKKNKQCQIFVIIFQK
jgi:hypothetical protein